MLQEEPGLALPEIKINKADPFYFLFVGMGPVFLDF